MSKFSPILSAAKTKDDKTLNDMAKVQIKSEKLTHLAEFFSIMEKFDSMLSSVIDSTLGVRLF